jgi:hypothetical protein
MKNSVYEQIQARKVKARLRMFGFDVIRELSIFKTCSCFSRTALPSLITSLLAISIALFCDWLNLAKTLPFRS